MERTEIGTVLANAGTPLKEDDIELELGLSIGRSYKKAPMENGLTDLKPGLAGESAQRSVDAQMEIDARAKREMQALRRQEAKRKREEKRLVKGGSLASNGVCQNGDIEYPAKAKLLRGGVGRNGCVNGGLMKNVNLNLTVEQNDGGLNVERVVVNGSHGNGWSAGGSVIRPVAGYGGPINDAGRAAGDGQDSEREGSCGDGRSGKGGSCRSPAGTSSAGSEHRRSTSREGGNSSEIKSHLSECGLDQPPSNGSKASDCECSATSGQVAPAAAANGGTDHLERAIPSNSSSPNPSGASMEAKPDKALDATRKHGSTPANPVHGPTRPPRPQTQNSTSSALSSMPCVSTTGNGPNGKTINGFLYRYTKAEVSIICVCHGTSFSPAEFVQHAGGMDVSNPLRHITVFPSAF